MAKIPSGYRQLAGSERKIRKGAKRVGPADPSETLMISIYVRRQPGAPALPGQNDFAATPPGQRKLLSRAELAASQGASPDDLKVVTDFAAASGLKVVQTDPHLGNYGVRIGSDGAPDRIVLYDFGAVRTYPDEFMLNYYALIASRSARASSTTLPARWPGTSS